MFHFRSTPSGRRLTGVYFLIIFFKCETKATQLISMLLQTTFSLQLCLGIYGEKLLKTIKLQQLKGDTNSTDNKPYKIDGKYMLINKHGEQILETVRSSNPQEACLNFFTTKTTATSERCKNCIHLAKNRSIFHNNCVKKTS